MSFGRLVATVAALCAAAGPIASAQLATRADDMNALIAIYNATGGAAWMEPWDITTDPCANMVGGALSPWAGVSCEVNGGSYVVT